MGKLFRRLFVSFFVLFLFFSFSSLKAITILPQEEGIGGCMGRGLGKGFAEGMRQLSIRKQQEALIEQQIKFQKAEFERKQQIYRNYVCEISNIMKDYKIALHVDYMNKLLNSNLPRGLSESLVKCYNDYHEKDTQLDCSLVQKYFSIVDQIKSPTPNFFIKVLNRFKHFILHFKNKDMKNTTIDNKSEILMNIFCSYNIDNHFQFLKQIEELEIPEMLKKELCVILNDYRYQKSKINLELSTNERELLSYYANQG